MVLLHPLYAVGQVKVLEKKLIPYRVFERILQTGDYSRVLLEEGFITPEGESILRKEPEKFFDNEFSTLYTFAEKTLPSPELGNWFRLKEDFANLKIVVKKGSELPEEFFSKRGKFKLKALMEAVEKSNFSLFPLEIQSELTDALKEFREKKNEQVFEVRVERTYLSYFFKIARKERNSFLKELAGRFGELFNIKTFIRLKFLDLPLQESFFLPLENKETSFYLKLESLGEFADFLKRTIYSSLTIPLGRLQTEGTFAFIEKEARNIIIATIKKNKYLNFGLEPIISYIIAREEEIKNLRLIVTGLKNKFPRKLIQELLANVY
jgi:V/A-type H+-transporting ATPase subunit C